MIVVVGGIKGGSGKTTIATNLAILNARKKCKTILIDADEQKSSLYFCSQRENFQGIQDCFDIIFLSGKDINKKILKLKKKYDQIIVDTGGRDTTTQRSALSVADIFLVPFRPRSIDIWTLPDLCSIINEIKTINSNMKAIAFINQGDPIGSDNEMTIDILKECNEFDYIGNTLVNRKIYSNTSSDGLGIIEAEVKDKKAIDELSALYDVVYEKDVERMCL